jgi:hypothetical protein
MANGDVALIHLFVFALPTVADLPLSQNDSRFAATLSAR